jgi:HEAT repeat protein
MAQASEPAGRYVALYCLMGYGPAAAELVPELLPLLESDDFHTQYWCCRVLATIGAPAALPAVPSLIHLLDEGVASVRRNAAMALGAIGPAAGTEILQPLSAALEDPLFPVRRTAAIALRQLGPFARPAVPALQAALAKRRAEQVQVALALYKITGDARTARRVLLEGIRGKDSPWEAAEGFGTLGADAEPAVQELISLLQSDDDELQFHAVLALGGIGPAAADALPALKTLQTLARQSDDDDDFLHKTLTAAIANIESGTKGDNR